MAITLIEKDLLEKIQKSEAIKNLVTRNYSYFPDTTYKKFIEELFSNHGVERRIKLLDTMKGNKKFLQYNERIVEGESFYTEDFIEDTLYKIIGYIFMLGEFATAHYLYNKMSK